MGETILITGSSGFIGYHLALNILKKFSWNVIGIDNENDYYDINLKEKRRKNLEKFNRFKFYKGDISNLDFLYDVFKNNNINIVCNLAAQAGVRYSFENPFKYVNDNIVGFLNIIELSKEFKVKKFLYASSSSVYGNLNKIPFSEADVVNKPISLYAATKLSDELISYVYSYNFGLITVGLRFFTVYGPCGRPDMAYFKFADKIIRGESIELYGEGKLKRDFTYIDDIIDGIINVIINDGYNKYEIFNLGNNKPIEINYLVRLLEKNLKLKAKIIYKEKPLGDVEITYADINKARKLLGWEPKVSIEEGINNFIKWYKNYLSGNDILNIQ